MEVIVPAAGKSSRFPNMKPKYLLYDYAGNLMIKNAVASYQNVTIGILKEHDDNFSASEHIKMALPNARIVIIKGMTNGPAATVYEIMRLANITEGPVLIRDCDAFFTHTDTKDSYVCVGSIQEHSFVRNLPSKSFVRYNENELIVDIIEKKVVSDTFCVGGYKFADARDFLKSFIDLQAQMANREVFVSHVIQDCLERGVNFSLKRVTNYVDVGTAQDWFEYNNKPVVFCDIDGTLIKAQGRHEYGQPVTILPKNLERVKEFARKGSQIVFTSSRPHSAAAVTEKLLHDLGFENFVLLIGLNNTKRILINDYAPHAPYPRAEAVNIERDTDTLEKFI